MHGGDIYGKEVKKDFSVNIHPLGLSGLVKQALEQALEDVIHYPEYDNSELRRAIAEYLGGDLSWEEILVGNGASELFMAIVHALRPGKVLSFAPAFSGYRKVCEAVGAVLHPIYLTEREQFQVTDQAVEEMCGEMKKGADLVFLTNPNNPTGALIPTAGLMRMLDTAEQTHTRVVLDECFLEFVGEGEQLSLIPLLQEYPHVMVVRAFTKICAIPGVRLGYGVGRDREFLDAVAGQIPEWNVSLPAQRGGRACARLLMEGTFLEDTRRMVKEQREYLELGLKELGFQVYPSDANFLLFSGPPGLKEKMLEKGFLIRDCRDYTGLGQGYYRVSVGTKADQDQLLQALKEII